MDGTQVMAQTPRDGHWRGRRGSEQTGVGEGGRRSPASSLAPRLRPWLPRCPPAAQENRSAGVLGEGQRRYDFSLNDVTRSPINLFSRILLCLRHAN